MSTYDPFRSEERPRIGVFSGLPSAPPGSVLVVDREGQPLGALEGHGDRLTAGEARWGQIRTLYTVDVTEHHLDFADTFPCSDDIGGFRASVSFACRVLDPVDVVRRGIHDVARALVPAIKETLRRECVRHEAEKFEEAERAAAQAVRDLEANGGHDGAFAVTNLHVVLTLDEAAAAFVRERKEVERSSLRQKDAVRLEREKTELERELASAKDLLEAERAKARAEMEQERLLWQKAQERLQAQLDDERQELLLAREGNRLRREHETDTTMEMKRLEFEGERQKKQAELDAQKLEYDLTQAHIKAQYEMKLLEARLAREKAEITQITELLNKGDYVALAMQLAQQPAAIGGVIKHMAQQRTEDTERQLRALQLLVENDGVEGFEITEQAKAVLVSLIDTWKPRRNEIGAAGSQPAINASTPEMDVQDSPNQEPVGSARPHFDDFDGDVVTSEATQTDSSTGGER